MYELIKLVGQKTGLPPGKAWVAIDTLMYFLKTKLQPNIAGQLDAVLAGGNLLEDLTKSPGGLIGGKK